MRTLQQIFCGLLPLLSVAVIGCADANVGGDTSEQVGADQAAASEVITNEDATTAVGADALLNDGAAPICVTIERGLLVHRGAAPETDLSILGGQPNTSFDHAANLCTGVSKGGTLSDTLLRFELITIPRTAQVTSATVTMREVIGVAPFGEVNAHRVLGAWDPPTTTWNSFVAGYDPATAASFKPEAVAGWLSFDVTSLVQDWVSGTDPNYGMLLEQSAGLTYYDDAAANAPALTVCYQDAVDPQPPIPR